MRPDELTGKTIQEREHAWNKTIKKTGSNALKLATTLGGVGISARIIPFLSEFISPQIALQGISKVSPKIGDFLNKGMSQGLSLSGGLQYLKSQLGGEGQYGGSEQEEFSPEQEDRLNKVQQGYEGLMKRNEDIMNASPEKLYQSAIGQTKEQAQMGQQQSQGDAALLAALEKILRM